MATTLGEAEFLFRLKVPELKASIGINQGTGRYDHIFEFIQKYLAGTGANKIDAVWSGQQVISGATPLDLRSSLTSTLDSAVVSFPIISGLFAVNLSTTTGETILMGAGSNPITSLWGASGDIVKIGPSGFCNLWNPIDGYATTAATADILNFSAAAGTPTLALLIVGRSV